MSIQQRIQKLQEKINTLSLVNESQKIQIAQENERKTLMLEKQLQIFEDQSQKDIHDFNSQLLNHEKQRKSEKSNTEIYIQKQSMKLKELERELKDLIDEEIRLREENEQEITDIIEQQYIQIQSLQQTQQKQREESVNNLKKYVAQEMGSLNQQFIQENKNSENELNKLEVGWKDVVQDLAIQLWNLQNQSQENDKYIYDLFKSVMEEVKQDVEKEQKEQHEMEKVILGLIENTCEKIAEFSL